MADRISSLDQGYQTGDLSIFPSAIDSTDTLYEAKNNARTELTHSLTYGGRFIQVSDASAFPDKGLITVGTEIIYYGERTQSTFKGLVRPFAGSIRRPWPMGTSVTNAVAAELHNAKKDAIYNIQHKLGKVTDTDEESLLGILQKQEQIYLAPKPLFRAAPNYGPAPLKVRFQNFSSGQAIRFLWDFGDGVTSSEESPTHIYLADGNYTVQLNMITALGATGVATKQNYISVNNERGLGFFYVTPTSGTTSTTFTFVDQTPGDIASRYWVWDDGEKTAVSQASVHTATHQYETAGSYAPKLLVVFADGRPMSIGLNETIEVTE